MAFAPGEEMPDGDDGLVVAWMSELGLPVGWVLAAVWAASTMTARISRRPAMVIQPMRVAAQAGVADQVFGVGKRVMAAMCHLCVTRQEGLVNLTTMI